MYPNLKDYVNPHEDKQYPAFLEHLLKKMDGHIKNQGKILLLTLTKKSSEEVTNFLVSK